ncbi:MAG: carbon monoxide dehydrogenase, partial [Desulfobacteraceae bacterium]|nr:carbon monoxide dehydrogenase [Desulfobacteraceae bacterium]
DLLTARIEVAVAEGALPLGGILPASPELVAQELSGRSYLELASDLPIVRQAFAIFEKELG